MIEIQNLSSSYTVPTGFFFKKTKIKAVEEITFNIPDGQIVGLVGESGCGKSSLGRAILRLQPIDKGNVIYNGTDIFSLKSKELLSIRKNLQIIFQDPYSSLNPKMTIFEIITEGLSIHAKYSKQEKLELVLDILNKVSLKEDILYRYPHEFSGGQRQRIAIARVLILKPDFIVCDEITSALDVSTQAQIVNLIQIYKKQNNISMLFISHDLSLVNYISDSIAVMYLGKIVEFGKKETLSKQSIHPYTKALFASTFEIANRKKKRETLKGEIPGVVNKPTGCYFHTRCPVAMDKCKTEVPEFKKVADNHFVACHLC
jgi:peptide/nickel transport system ATP-binding protein